ncbi:MAG: ABC transporter permease [Armatimonadota bacterium]|nr:ABC transporter permease [Armatimonadota bacterium]MDR7451228.1 ABC transporter permease [Armatimonadota bacterium]MDR7466869.1 ABC transporter permease [Armatimonadota bacterium]MDR7492658.1 ABC transporter permease [Armatimonadota bacterium]MDR7499980.1 ABC transporter permease [Armatimonadota bacterium]
MGIGRYILTRLALTVPMLLILLTLVFLILRILPGDPCLALLGGRNITAERLEECREGLGLNRPLPIQYLDYLADAVRLDFGTSIRTGQPVARELLLRFPATIELAVFGMAGATLLGLVSGVFASVRRDRRADHVVRVLNIASFAMPVFWIGLMFLMLFAVRWRLFPAGGRLDPVAEAFFRPITNLYTLDTLLRGQVGLFLSALHHLALPALTLAIVVSGFIGRMTRSSMLDVLDREYVTVARAKGLPEPAVILRHALSNALIPIVTVVGLQFALLMAGAILTETVYSWPGIARYLLEAISSRDFTAIQGAVIFIAFFIAAVNLLVDVLYARLNPRIRF